MNIIPMPEMPHETRKKQFAEWKAKKCGHYIDSSRLVIDRQISCRICKQSTKIPIQDQYSSHSVLYTDKNGYIRTKILKTNKQAMQWFIDQHFESCIKMFGLNKEQGK